jgi:Helix-turn-helix domain
MSDIDSRTLSQACMKKRKRRKTIGSIVSFPPLLLKECEAARMLNISPRLLWSLSNQGLVPFIRLGGAKRYSPEDLKAFIQSEREKGPKKR